MINAAGPWAGQVARLYGRELPITPDKVLRALEKKNKGEPARVGPEHFPAVPYPEPVVVPPPWEGGDGTAVAPQKAYQSAN